MPKEQEFARVDEAFSGSYHIAVGDFRGSPGTKSQAESEAKSINAAFASRIKEERDEIASLKIKLQEALSMAGSGGSICRLHKKFNLRCISCEEDAAVKVLEMVAKAMDDWKVMQIPANLAAQEIRALADRVRKGEEKI